jgi:hypothetical protein
MGDVTSIVEIPMTSWNAPCPDAVRERAVRALEDGSVLLFPGLAFEIEKPEAPLLSATILAKGKNVSYDAATGKVAASRLDEAGIERLKVLMRRFVDHSGALLANVLPGYVGALVRGRTSLRPVEVEGRPSSWRKDDTRLHVDAFPASPVRDRRILRVFSNVNPLGQTRNWRVGEPFERVARRFLPSLSTRLWGRGLVLRALGITRSRRSAYDHCMLQIHDNMKADLEYQASANQFKYNFPAGTTWIMYSDQVSHAVLSGQHALEQTCYLPVARMQDPVKSPLKILERLTCQTLV